MNKNLKYLNSQRPKTKANKGIALLVALGTMIVILIIGSLAIYLITRGVRVTAGQTRYETAFEAATAALEIGKARAKYLNQELSIPDTSDAFMVGQYSAQTYVERTSFKAVGISGHAIKFARAAAGPGQTPAFGSYRTYYIRADAANTASSAGEQVMLEVLMRYTILQE